MIEPGKPGSAPGRSFGLDQAPTRRDERSMLFLEYLVSITALAAALLLGVLR